MELADPVTPSMREVSAAERLDDRYVYMVPADDDEPVVVHGMLRNGPRRVTLVDAVTTGRQQIMLAGQVEDPGMQSLRADYAVLGQHISGRDARFRHVQLQLQHLDDWAQLPGLAVEVALELTTALIRHEQPEEEAVVLSEPAGRLVLDCALTMRQPSLRGGAVTRAAVLRWESSEAGLTIDELWSRVVDPLRVLLTLVVDADNPAVSMEVRASDGDPWLQVVHPGLDSYDPEPKRVQVLLTRDHLGLSQVGRWLSRAKPLSPIPQLVAGVAVSSSQRTIQNQLLELAAAADGLHRRLYADERAMTRQQARDARRAAGEAVHEELRKRVTDALRRLDEPTYRERLDRLLERVGEAASGATGDAEAWLSKIVDARNGFAHQIDSKKHRDVEWQEHLVLLRSLRWLLTALLLLEAGIAPATLADRLRQHPSYLQFRRHADQQLPAVYPGAAGRVSREATD